MKENREPNDRTKKMLVISPWESMWSLGGTAGVSDDYRFVDKFTRNGYELHFLVPKGAPGSQPDVENFHIHPYPNIFKAISKLPTPLKRILLPFLFNFIVMPRAFRLASTLQADFVLGHSHYSTVTSFALRKFRSVHSGVKLFGVMDLVHTEWPRWKYMLKNFEQIVALKFPQDVWIVLDDGTRGKDALLRHGVERERIHFLPNGIDLEWANQIRDGKRVREELGIPQDVCVAVFLARLVPSKRPEAVIQAIPRALQLTTKKMLFLFVGDGSSKASCEALARQLGVEEHSRFLGAVPHARVPDIFCASDLFVSTSNLTNMAIPTCEALVCGVPAAVFDVGDTGKVVKNGENGRLVADGDIEGLARAIADLSANEEERAAMGRRAKEFALEHFMSWEDRTDKELEIIDKWVRGPRP